MNDRYCKVCSAGYADDDPLHNNSTVHRFNFALYEWNEFRKALYNNRHGVEVAIRPRQINGHLYNYSEHITKGKHCLQVTPVSLYHHQNVLEFLCTIKNVKKGESVLLTSAKLLHPYPLYSLYDPNNVFDDGKIPELFPKSEYPVVVRFNPQNVVIGSYKIPVSFTFQTTGKKSDNFTIVRSIIVSVAEEIMQEDSIERSPFTGNAWSNVFIHPPTKKQFSVNDYPIPPSIYKFFQFGFQEFTGMGIRENLILQDLRKQMAPGHVTAANYKNFWHNVLWLEEMGQILQLQKYNMENVKLRSIGAEMLELNVPGLAEKRPSVIVGDMIDIRAHDDHTAYRGIIKNVNDKTVYIAYVDKQFLSYIESNPDIEVDVRFMLGRLPLERMHQAVDQVVQNQLVPLLFPTNTERLLRRQVPQTRTVLDSEFYNRMIVHNLEQKTAVRNILNHSSQGTPYIVFGPPGTGKTVTIVEAILQLKNKTKNKILVCAPANAACDMLTEKLMSNCSKKELIRIMSETVDKQSMNPHIQGYTNYTEDQGYIKLVPEELKQYRIVVTTLILVGRYTKKYHPDVVFVDEAAQACEPEVDCALGVIARGKQIVLAGDPKQLGPSVASKVAAGYGLGQSLLERLMELDLYKTPNANFITMLKQNFRSHSLILRLPNMLFYNNQLQAMSVKSENDPLSKILVFEKIQRMIQQGGRKGRKKASTSAPGRAIEFCSLISKECRQGRSPSYFNTKEMQTVLKYVQALVTLDLEVDDKVLQEQIGVVTPYKRQAYKIKELLRYHQLEGVEVGTTETFQGREKRVIIISTVRAQHDLLLYDKKYNLGFVKNEKRFDVVMTRAMSKLIIVGCAHVLATDTNWLAFMELCEEEGAFCGEPFAKRTPDVMEEITKRMRHVQMRDTQHDRH